MALEYTSPEDLLAAQVGQPLQAAAPVAASSPVIAERQGVPKELANDLMFITRLTAPTGEVVRAAPNDIDGLISAGYKPVNLEKTWDVTRLPGTEPIKVRGGDLQSYIKQGYRTNKAEETDTEGTKNTEQHGAIKFYVYFGFLTTSTTR